MSWASSAHLQVGLRGLFIAVLALSMSTGSTLSPYHVIRSPQQGLVSVAVLSVLAGGDDQTLKLLENLSREQTTLGNLQPGQRFSLADKGKSVKAIFAAAGDAADIGK